MACREPGRLWSNNFESAHPVSDKIIDQSQSAPNVGYVLNRDYAASTRLNCQFFLWKEELGFNLHPSINISASGSRIADIATGTAIWLVDLARSLPDSQLDGFDISLEQCPPLAWLPASVSVDQWDIFSRVPPALKSQYDVVHIRLALLVVRQNDPRPILRNILELLKPGGYLQWDELNVFEASVAGTDPGVCTEKFQRAQELTDLRRLGWVRELRGIVTECGFEKVQEFKYECNLTLAKYYQDIQFLVMEEEAANAPTVDKKVEVYQAINKTYAESKKGIARCTPKVVIVAKKSSPE